MIRLSAKSDVTCGQPLPARPIAPGMPHPAPAEARQTVCDSGMGVRKGDRDRPLAGFRWVAQTSDAL